MKNVIFLFAAVLSLASCQEPKNKITINTDEVITENFIGNGVQWDAYPHGDSETAEWGLLMTDAKWQQVFDRLDYMQPRLVRTLDQANWRYLQGFDKQGNAILNFDTSEEKALEKLLGYCQKNNITVLMGEWGTPFEVHDTDKGFSGILKGATDPRWIDMIVKHLDYLINQKGFTCIRYFNLVNEPNGYWASTDGNWDEWSQGATMLAEAIKKAGLNKYVSVAGPDAVAHYDHPDYNLTGMQWVEESAKLLNDQLGALEIHAYFQKEVIREAQFDSLYRPLAQAAKSINKPIFFGEMGFEKSTPENQARVEADSFACPDSYMGVYDFQHGIDMADAAIQIMNTGFSGVAAWGLDDAMHTNNDNGDKQNLKRWGMWNTLGTELCNNPADETIRPWFFTWSLLCRYLPAGSEIVKTQMAELPGVRVASAINNNEITVALVNQSDNQVEVSLAIPSQFEGKMLKLFNYEEGNLLTDNNGFPVAETDQLKQKRGTISLKLKAKSFKLITSFQQ